MRSLFRITVPEQHTALLFEDEQFVQVLPAGVHKFRNPFRQRHYAVYGCQPDVENAVSEEVLSIADDHGSDFEPLLERWHTSENQVGLVYQDGALKKVLAPASRGAYWKGIRPVEVRLLDIAEDGEVDSNLARRLRGARSNTLRTSVANAIVTLTVPEGHVGFLQVDGKRLKVLQPGVHVYWKFDRDVSGRMLDCRLQNMEVNGQEILTADKVSLRVNLSATWRVIDAERVMERLADHSDFLYRELQLALRTVVSTRTLDELLEDKNLLNAKVRELVTERAGSFGLEVSTVGARDIVLPGDMKEILSQVVEAQKRAEANLIQRREETQATRSLHNTAKVMEGNPTLLRLKELEVLEKVSSQIGTLNVYGGLNGVMKDLVALKDTAVDSR